MRKPLCNADSKQSGSGKMIYNLQKEGRLWVLLEVSARSRTKHLKGVSPVLELTWKSPSRAPESPCGVSLGHIVNTEETRSPFAWESPTQKCPYEIKNTSTDVGERKLKGERKHTVGKWFEELNVGFWQL